MAAPQASSRLEMLQARFQQRQLIEKEQKLLQLYDQQQLRAHQVAQRGSAGSNCSNSSGHGSNGTTTHHQTVTRTSTTTQSTSNSQGGGKVRQMFDERRQTSVKGIDKSYPLEPLDNRSRKQQTTTGNVVVSSTSPTKNGNPMSNRQSVVTRRTARSEVNSNINGGKPIVSYHEEVTRESCGPTEGVNDPEEFGDENDEVSRYANGNPHIDQRSEVHIEDATNENTTQRHRTTAKIHLAGFDSDSGTNRVGDDLDNEQFPDVPVRSVPDRLPRRGPAAKKPSQAEARFERFKNTNTNRPPGKTTKQMAGNTTSFTKKRTETTINSGSSSRASTVTRTMEEDTSRGRSPSPDLGSGSGRPRSSSPEVADRETNSPSPLVDRRSLVTKSSSGISKVSQLTHKNSLDFYPRRKSEFEKSKTFRKLQLELGESSPEPAEPEAEVASYPRQCRKRGSILEPNIYTADRRSSSPSPAADRSRDSPKSRDRTPEAPTFESPIYRRKSATSRDRTPEAPTFESPIYRRKSATSRDRTPEAPTFESPIYRRKSATSRERTPEAPTFESLIYRRKSATSRDRTPEAPTFESPIYRRKSATSRDRTPEAPTFESPIYRRKSATSRDDTKTRNVESSVYSCQRRETSFSYQTTDRDPAKRADRERSAERPRSRGGSESPIDARGSSLTHEETKRSSAEDNTHSSRRRSSSTGPVADRDLARGRRTSRDKSAERPRSRGGSESPIYGGRSSLTHEETKRSSVEASTFSSRRHSSSASPVADRDSSNRRRASDESSPERPASRGGSESPVYRRKSTVTNEDITTGRATSSERRATREDSTSRNERPACVRMTRKRSESPRDFSRSSVDRQQSRSATDARKKSGETLRSFELVKKLVRPGNPETKATTTTKRSWERKTTLEDVEFPVHRIDRRDPKRRTKSPEHRIVKKDKAVMEASKEEPKAKVTDRKNYVCERSARSRSRTISPSPPRSTSVQKPTVGDVEFPVHSADRKDPKRRTKSPEHKIVRKNKAGMETSKEEPKAKVTDRKNYVCERSVRSRSRTISPSPPRSTSVQKSTLGDVEFPVHSADRKDPKRRTKSPEHKIVRKNKAGMETSKEEPKAKVTDRKNYVCERSVRSRSRTISPSPPRSTSVQKPILGDVEFPVHSVDRKDPKRRAKSPEHKIGRKEKAMEPSKAKVTDRKNSSDTGERIAASRSRSVSPSAPPSTTMKETASFRAKKVDRRDSVEAKRDDSKDRQEEKRIGERNRINLSYEGRSDCERIYKPRSPSPEEDRHVGSRRSSSETIVKRHETFRVGGSGRRIVGVERSVDTDEGSIGKAVRADSTDKSQLLERIENIRTTISRSGGRSMQSLESKDFERTDSVESALKRFDSIGVETEHHVTVGVDEPDVLPVDSSRKETLRDAARIVAKKSVDTRCKSGKTTVGSVKAQPRKIDGKARAPSGEKLSRTDSREKHSESAKSAKVGMERSARAATPRRSEDKFAPKSRVGRKIATSIVRKSMLRREEPSGRGEGKESDRSPSCKRRLFDDSESEIDTDNSRSTVVLSTIVRVTKSPEIVESTNFDDRDDVEAGEKIVRSESSIGESKADFEQPTKVLRSIEDIRKSIKRESQDFNRELCKFNTAMRRDAERSASGRTDSTVRSGIISRVEIKKTLKAGADSPVVEIRRTTVKLPIAHRVAKSPSPDIGTKRTTDHRRARTPTASVRRSVPSSPAKSPDATGRYGSAELKSTGSKLLSRPSTSPSSLREDGNRSGSSRTSVYSDFTDGPGNHFPSTVTESVFSVATKTHEAFVVELDDDGVSSGKDGVFPKPPLRKKSSDTSLTTSQKQQRSPTGTPLPRPTSALSIASSSGSARCQSKIGMATKTKSPTSTAPKVPPGSARVSAAAAVNDGLAACNICGRRFNSDRINLHEQICSKTATKKRKQFDATIHRVKGTELEPFVKKAGSKKPQADRKSQKPEVKSNWRRKHEDFINAIRSAKQVQAHLAAGGKLSDLPPPPASDTSDYVQCPHCGRKFNQGAAERHIPKCQNMLHNKPNPRAPPKPKR